MRPCSAYCVPDEDIHVTLDYARDVAVSLARVGQVGKVGDADNSPSCLPPGTVFKVLNVELAAEAPESPYPGFPHAILMTVVVQSRLERFSS